MMTELAVAVPLVMTERLARLAMAGPVPSEHDGREFNRMYTEKAHAFTASWFAMTRAAILFNQELVKSFFRPFDPAAFNDVQTGAMDVVGKGLAPLHKAATDNVVRLVGRRRA